MVCSYVGLIALTYFSHPFESSVQLMSAQDARQRAFENAKKGVWAVVFVYLGYSTVQGPSTPHMVRPHPSFWKFVHGVMICYLSFMVYLLFQNVNDARLFLKVRDSISLQQEIKRIIYQVTGYRMLQKTFVVFF